MIEQIANGIDQLNVLDVLVDLLEQFVEFDRQIKDTFGLIDTEALQSGSDQVTEPDVLLFGADDGMEPIFDELRQPAHLPDVGVREKRVTHGQQQDVRRVQSLPDDRSKVEQMQRRAGIGVGRQLGAGYQLNDAVVEHVPVRFGQVGQ